MKRIFINSVTLLFLTFALFSGCSNSPTDNSDQTDQIDKSPKRGLAFNLTDSADFSALKKGVSWWYNWYYQTDAPADYYHTYQMEFVPMLWGHNSSQDFLRVQNFILDHPEIEYLLVMNEPNLTDQVNMLPGQAATEWIKYEQVVEYLKSKSRTVYLVGPAMNWGTLQGYEDPVVWLDAFYSAYKAANEGREPQIDYLAFHWYDYGLEAQLDRLRKYGKKIWITEMANWNAQINSYTKQTEQMQQMVALCEQREDVFRYAWFIGRGQFPDSKHTYLFNPTPGQLNELGQLYINLPWTK